MVFKSEYVHNVFLVSVLVSVSERPAQHLARTVFLLSSILGRVSPCPSVATCLLAVVCQAEYEVIDPLGPFLL